MGAAVLVINAGSSSIKFSIHTGEAAAPRRVLRGQIEGLGSDPRLVARDADGAVLADQRFAATAGRMTHAQALDFVEHWLVEHLNGLTLIAAGHRVVHGGPDLREPVLINDAVLDKLETFVPLAPLHQPHNLAAIRAIADSRPELPQVACFDTAFHRGQPGFADRFALPEAYFQQGVRRYGFHGLSYEHIARTLRTVAPEVAEGRVVIAHLGSGASMCGLLGGRSMDSTMGLTALDGLPMGTRCGSLDPGVVIHLQRSGMSLDEVEHLLYRNAGLLGISGVSNDMRDLLASDEPLAAVAVDYFVYRVSCELGSLAAAIGGLDALVFTAGIGENSPAIRARVCKLAAWLGIELDESRNNRGAQRISPDGAKPSVWVLPTNEERMIATHTLAAVARA